MNYFNKPLLLLAFLFSSFSAGAMGVTNTIDVGIYNQKVGDTFNVSLAAEFETDTLDGGTLTLNWDDSILQFNSFAYNVSYDLAVQSNPTSDSLKLDWAIFTGSGIGHNGSFTLGTINYTALATGVSALSFTATDSVAVATFSDGSVTVSAVPLPTTAWLFLSAVVSLGLANRKKSMQ